MKLLLIWTLLFASLGLYSQEKDSPLAVIESTSQWNGYKRDHFTIDLKSAWVTCPKVPAPGNPWIWRARFPGFHDEIDKEMLRRGYFVAHINTENMFGAPKAIKIWDKMYQFVVKHYSLNPKVVLVGVSRGGLFIYNFANEFPERVAVIYGDTPVMDFTSWPEGKNGTGTASPKEWELLKKIYGFKDDTSAESSLKMPIFYEENLAKNKISIYHVIGPKDKIVPPQYNTLKFQKNYSYCMVVHENKGPYTLEGHHFPLDNVKGSCDFMEKYTPLPTIKNENDFVTPRAGIGNTIKKITSDNTTIRVLFLGGSITEMPGWQNMTIDYLKTRFPLAKFEFKNVGISSHCSAIHAFRWRTDFAGKADLVFFESAVNDLHNERTEEEQQRAYEGVIRGIKKENPTCDIICLHFAEPTYNALYHQNITPSIIARHDAIANHYQLPSINLAKEVAFRLKEKQFSWEKDFKDLHPAEFGQRLYFQAIKRLLDTQNQGPPSPPPVTRFMMAHLNRVKAQNQDTPPPPSISMPPAMVENTWENGHFLPLENFKNIKGFSIHPNWSAKPGTGGQRSGYYHCPMLVSDTAGSMFSFNFEGSAVGLFVISGYDSAAIEWQVDGGEWKCKDTITKWSQSIHLPFAYILEGNLPYGNHKVTIRTKQIQNRSALRIRYIMVN